MNSSSALSSSGESIQQNEMDDHNRRHEQIDHSCSVIRLQSKAMSTANLLCRVQQNFETPLTFESVISAAHSIVIYKMQTMRPVPIVFAHSSSSGGKVSHRLVAAAQKVFWADGNEVRVVGLLLICFNKLASSADWAALDATSTSSKVWMGDSKLIPEIVEQQKNVRQCSRFADLRFVVVSSLHLNFVCLFRSDFDSGFRFEFPAGVAFGRADGAARGHVGVERLALQPERVHRAGQGVLFHFTHDCLFNNGFSMLRMQVISDAMEGLPEDSSQSGGSSLGK
jgi:hypothetical protein